MEMEVGESIIEGESSSQSPERLGIQYYKIKIWIDISFIILIPNIIKIKTTDGISDYTLIFNPLFLFLQASVADPFSNIMIDYSLITSIIINMPLLIILISMYAMNRELDMAGLNQDRRIRVFNIYSSHVIILGVLQIIIFLALIFYTPELLSMSLNLYGVFGLLLFTIFSWLLVKLSVIEL